MTTIVFTLRMDSFWKLEKNAILQINCLNLSGRKKNDCHAATSGKLPSWQVQKSSQKNAIAYQPLLLTEGYHHLLSLWRSSNILRASNCFPIFGPAFCLPSTSLPTLAFFHFLLSCCLPSFYLLPSCCFLHRFCRIILLFFPFLFPSSCLPISCPPAFHLPPHYTHAVCTAGCKTGFMS